MSTCRKVETKGPGTNMAQWMTRGYIETSHVVQQGSTQAHCMGATNEHQNTTFPYIAPNHLATLQLTNHMQSLHNQQIC